MTWFDDLPQIGEEGSRRQKAFRLEGIGRQRTVWGVAALEILLGEVRIGRLHFMTGPEPPDDGADDHGNAPIRAVAASPDCEEISRQAREASCKCQNSLVRALASKNLRYVCTIQIR
jgi:hypothetical protein